jgi:hypothetical protein
MPFVILYEHPASLIAGWAGLMNNFPLDYLRRANVDTHFYSLTPVFCVLVACNVKHFMDTYTIHNAHKNIMHHERNMRLPPSEIFLPSNIANTSPMAM